MTDPEAQLMEDRALRDAARGVFDTRLNRIRLALGQKGVARRATDEAVGRARTVANEGIEIARESRWIVVSVLVALGTWLFRRPLADATGRAVRKLRPGEPPTRRQRFRDWMQRKVRT